MPQCILLCGFLFTLEKKFCYILCMICEQSGLSTQLDLAFTQQVITLQLVVIIGIFWFYDSIQHTVKLHDIYQCEGT